MERICAEPELASFQVLDAVDSLERLSHAAFSAGLLRPGLMFAQIRSQLMRIEAGIPFNESCWLCLADLLSKRWTELEEINGDRD